jgi:hypothetical protein
MHNLCRITTRAQQTPDVVVASWDRNLRLGFIFTGGLSMESTMAETPLKLTQDLESREHRRLSNVFAIVGPTFPRPHILTRLRAIISVGPASLSMLVVATSLIVLGVPAESLERLPMPAAWLQTGRWIGLVAYLIGGGALLWYVLRR